MSAIAGEETAASGIVFNVMRYSLHDGPGIRTTVFFKGCPLNCWWCHNPESRSFQPELMYFAERCGHCGCCIAACPEQAIEEVGGEPRPGERCRRCGSCVEACHAGAREMAGRRVTLGEVMSDVEKDVVFFDESGGGVTLSGGEPLAQPQFAEAILDACRERRIHTALETCGLAQRTTMLCIAAKTDLVLYDLKLVDDARHRQHTGVSNEVIIANLKALSAAGARLAVRIPVVPRVNDSDQDVQDFIDCLSAARVRAVDLLSYHRIGVGKYRRLGMSYAVEDLAPPAGGDMERIRNAFARAGFEVSLGG